MVFKAVLLLSLALCAGAAPSSSPAKYPPNTCTIASTYQSSNGTADDSPAIASAFAECADGGTVVFSEGIDYNVFTPITATNLSHTTIQVYGNLHLPQNITAVQELFNETTYASGGSNLFWFAFSGPGIKYVGTSDVTTGWIYSYGQAWWDANAVNATSTPGRAHLMLFNTTRGSMQHFKSMKPIAWNVQVRGSDIEVSDTIIDAYSTGGFPFNTDGLDIAATNVEITNSVIYNGDDAIAVESGSHNVTFTRGTIGYQTHGMSIGSLGQNQASFANVSDIHFDDITVVSGVYAARFKSWIGGQGLASNISWTNMRVYNTTFPIFVTQTYINQRGSATQLESGGTTGRPNNSTVNMQGFTWANFTGSINTYQPGDRSCATEPCWYDVGLPDLKHTEAVVIECNTESSCRNFRLENIEVFPQSMATPTTVCINATAELNPDMGFECRIGTFVPTMQVDSREP